MSFNADAITLTLLSLLALLVVGIAVYVLAVRMKARREQRDIVTISATIKDYFHRSGVEVSAACTRLSSNGRFTAVVESEPMKRFRLSHIIEMTLRDHVKKTCGLDLDKVYWRFPIKQAEQAVQAAQAATLPNATAAQNVKAMETKDDYINEGLEHYKYIPKVEATELSWEHFEQAATTDPKDPEQAEQQRGQ